MITIELPWPPSNNTYWRHVMVKGAQRHLISKRGRSYRTEVYAAWLQCMDRRAIPLDGRVKVDITAYPPDRRKRDLDNLPKAIFDALTHVQVWKDDSQVEDFRIRRETVQAPGSVIVSIERLE